MKCSRLAFTLLCLAALSPAMAKEAAVAEALPPGGWVPAVRERINALIERNRGNPDAYAVFDFDYTTAIGDLSYACMWRLMETFDFKTDDFRRLFVEGLPSGYEEEAETVCALATKLKPFAGSDLTKRPEWREFIMCYWTFYRRLFVAVGDYRAYLWRSRMFAGHTPEELRALATDAVRQNLAKGHMYRPSYMPKEKRGLVIPQEMKDLFRALRQAGIAVYIVSGSFQETLWAATGPDFGLDIDPSCVFGADFRKDATGRYMPEMVKGCVKSGEKPAFIRAHIAPRHHGAEPVLTAGDSMGDYTMLTEFRNLQLALVFMRNWREKEMHELVASGGRVVAQGRDESRGVFIPEPKCIEPGEEGCRHD